MDFENEVTEVPLNHSDYDYEYLWYLEQKVVTNPYVIAADQVRLYGNVILIPTGFILNVLSFIIFYKIKRHKSATGSHIMCMAVADNFALLGVLLLQKNTFFDDKWLPRIHDLSSVLCKSSEMIVNGGALWSGLLLASATIERFCCIAYPMKMKTWNLLTFSKIFNVMTFFLSFGLNILVGYHNYIGQEFNKTVCLTSDTPLELLSDQIINTFFSHIVITSVILIFTIAMAVQLRRARKDRKTLSQDIAIRSNKEFVITTMLFAIACLFLATRLPVVVVYQIALHYSTKQVDIKFLQLLNAAYYSAILLLVINHSMNFVIYIVFFQEFRTQFVSFFTGVKSQNEAALRRSSTRISTVTVNQVQQLHRQVTTII